MTDFKSPVKRIKNVIIFLVAIDKTNLNKLKACVIITVKLTGELNTLLTAL